MKSIFIPHGGGPLPLLHDSSHRTLCQFLQQIPKQISSPNAIVVISAHWESDSFEITAHPAPQLLYDYSGFPKESYQIKYPAKGAPELAKKIEMLIAAASLPTQLNPNRKWDHGVFVPLKLMYPKADIPIVQISLHKSLDPAMHIELGEALRQLNKENILILGSGFSYHNMRGFFSSDKRHNLANQEFHLWLKEICTTMHREAMFDHLRTWMMAPSARLCHPREEHLAPLFVCAGAGSGKGSAIFDNVILGKKGLGVAWI